MLGEVLGPFFDDLGFHEGCDGGHDAEWEMAAPSVGGTKEELQ